MSSRRAALKAWVTRRAGGGAKSKPLPQGLAWSTTKVKKSVKPRPNPPAWGLKG